MKIDINLWNRAQQLDRVFIEKSEVFSRTKIAEELQVPEMTARFLRNALMNKHIISKQIPELPSKTGTTLVMSDLHIPYQDESAINNAIEYSKQYNINRIVLLGDVLDFYKVSFFRKKPGKKTVREEFEAGKQFLTELRHTFPDVEIILLYGNHEERLDNYLLDNVPELIDILPNLIPMKLGLKELNIQHYTSFFKIGYLWFLHGHEKGRGGNPEYITNVMWKYVHDNFICGHWHRQQDKIFPHITEKRFQGSVIGWLGDRTHIDYQKIKNDVQGFALVEFDDKGRFKTYPKKIIQGEIY